MENKYYTPDIEEFHVGFEYEQYTTVLGEIQEGIIGKVREYWKKTFMNAHTDIIAIDFNIRRNKLIRVKCLDREDIESLGFVCKGKDEEFDYIGYNLNNGFQLQEWGENRYSIERYPTAEHKTIHFVGTIKNKSELKKLMKQLQII